MRTVSTCRGCALFFLWRPKRRPDGSLRVARSSDSVPPSSQPFGGKQIEEGPLLVVRASPPRVASRVLGRIGSFSRMVRRIASTPEASSSRASNGVLPANSP